ncbi:MAG: hypothetical protein EON58_23090 [Alphaproteobacteria bacterium]|nr:MAG: hypothetical protein EON58_23090 [Alphaproteobacteria bacterium]
MIILSDSDVVRKLAYCELLAEFLQYLKCPPNEVWVLPTLRFQLRRKLANAPEALRNFEQFLLKVKNIPQAKIDTLERFESLDVGEGQLLAILCDEPRVSQLVTGDKKALDKVAALTYGDEQLRVRLQETTVLCLESILIGLVAKRGFNVVQARVRKWVKSAASVGDTVDPFVLEAFPASGGSAEDADKELGERLATLKARLSQLSFD